MNKDQQEAARAAADAQGLRYARRVLRFGGLAVVLVIVGAVLLLATEGTTKTIGIIALVVGVLLGLFVARVWLPVPPLVKRSINQPLGDGTVEVVGKRLRVRTPRTNPMVGRALAARKKGMPSGEAPALIFGELALGGKVVVVVAVEGGEPWVAGATGLKVPRV